MLIKLSIVVAAFYFIYTKLTHNENLSFNSFISFSSKNNVFLTKNLLFLIILSFFNWFFEILKWQKIVSTIKQISLKEATEQSLGALTASLFTPNRIGEYGAKAMYYSPNYRKRILLINLLSNMLQMSVTVIFGGIGFYFFTTKYPIEINPSRLLKLMLIGILILTLIGFVICKNKFTIKGFSLIRIKEFVLNFSKKVLVTAFTLSILRYLIFSFQFYFLLSIFEVDIYYFNAMAIITSMYLLASILPSIFIFDVIIKGSISIYLFTFIGVNELTILSIITIMWLLNFVFPSIIGSYFVLNFNSPKSSEKL